MRFNTLAGLTAVSGVNGTPSAAAQAPTLTADTGGTTRAVRQRLRELLWRDLEQVLKTNVKSSGVFGEGAGGARCFSGTPPPTYPACTHESTRTHTRMCIHIRTHARVRKYIHQGCTWAHLSSVARAGTGTDEIHWVGRRNHVFSLIVRCVQPSRQVRCV